MTDPDAIRAHALSVAPESGREASSIAAAIVSRAIADNPRQHAVNQAVMNELVDHCAMLRDQRDRTRLWCYAWAGAAITLALAWLCRLALD